ncbi:MAG: SRPBCC family protein [Bacillota bacterium]
MSINQGFQIEQEILIKAPREQVFKALTEKAEDRWGFRLAPNGEASHFTFEPIPGGQFIENWGKTRAQYGGMYIT